jgi:hypothetical protein
MCEKAQAELDATEVATNLVVGDMDVHAESPMPYVSSSEEYEFLGKMTGN